MSTIVDSMFDPTARERIGAAVAEAERGTSGEIVPCVVEQSDDYEESLWLAALIGAGLALVTITVIDIALDPWGLFGLPVFALIVAGAAALSALAAGLSPSLRIVLAGRGTVEQRALQAAHAAFVAEQVFATRDRTGILIFLSLREHRVVVLGDSGIDTRVGPDAWKEIVATIVDGIRAGAPVDALVEAIGRCGRILRDAGCVLAPDDTNELPDALRIARGGAGAPPLP